MSLAKQQGLLFRTVWTMQVTITCVRWPQTDEKSSRDRERQEKGPSSPDLSILSRR